MTGVPLRLVPAAAAAEYRHDPAAGQIALCPKNDCGYRCCEFQQGNYIVLVPGELDEARKHGLSLDHLRITKEERGGHRAICHARDTGTCDGGYKPLDCQSYPFFPTLGPGEDEVSVLLKGRKCPLVVAELGDHEAWVRGVWNRLIAARPQIRSWLRRVVLVGYDPVQDR
jgi:Fe-S-cluster containining protein